MTHELVRRGNVFEALPSGAQEASRRLARASLVSSELLRSAHSVDALRSVLAEDSAYTVDRKDSDTGDQFASRKHHSYRYSSGPAPTLASLVEDDDDLDLPPANMDYTKAKQRKSRHRNSGKRPYDRMPHRNSDWGSKSSKSYTSHRSGKSSAQFTVASHAPSLPTLHNTNIRAQIADKEATLPFTKLARRASTLGEILDNKPEQKRYISYPIDENGPLHEYDELRELRYSNQLRKARRKMEVGLPTLWNSHTPAGSVASRERLDNAAFRLKHNTVSTENQYHVHPNVSLEERHFRRRKSYPASQLQEIMSTRSEKPSSSDLYGRSSFSSSGSGTDDDHAPPPKKITYWQTLPPQKKRKLRLAAFLLLSLVIAAVIGIAVPLSKGSSARAVDCKRTCSSQRTPVFRNGVCMCQCSGNRGGPFCDLGTLSSNTRRLRRLTSPCPRRRYLRMSRWLRRMFESFGQKPAQRYVDCRCIVRTAYQYNAPCRGTVRITDHFQ